MAWTAAAAVLIFAVAGWLWLRTQHSVLAATEVLDLREASAAPRQNPMETEQQPLELHRWARHLILYLPTESQEGAHDIALLSETGAQIVGSSGTARLENHVVCLRVDVDLSIVQPGGYFLAVRQTTLTPHFLFEVQVSDRMIEPTPVSMRF